MSEAFKKSKKIYLINGSKAFPPHSAGGLNTMLHSLAKDLLQKKAMRSEK